jgi:GT2 family glycosyltransferase
MTLPLVSIIVVDWHGLKDTRDCIASIYLHCNKLDWELVIIDNNALPLDIPSIVSVPDNRIKIVNNKCNVGFAAACNQGSDVASKASSYLLFLNNDTVLTTDFISECLRYMEINPNVGACSPCIDYFDPRDSPWFHGATLNERQGLAVHINDVPFMEAVEVPWLTGCSLFVRKSVFELAGKFDDSLFMYCEDVDLSIKIRKLGYELVLFPQVGLLHKVSASAKQRALKSLFFDVRNKFIMCRRHYVGYSIVPYVSVFCREVRTALRSDVPLHQTLINTSIVLLAFIASLVKK